VETILSFFSDLVLFTAGLVVFTIWIVIFVAIAIEIHDAFTESNETDEGEDD